MEELRGGLRSNRRRSIKDHWQGRVPDLQLRWTAIRGAINVVNYAPSGLWSVSVRESEKGLLEASDVIGEVQTYWEALYAKRPVNLPAFERLVRAHIPKGVPEEWRLVQEYTLQVKKVPTRTGPRCAPSACYPCRLAPDQRLHLSKSRVQNPKI